MLVILQMQEPLSGEHRHHRWAPPAHTRGLSHDMLGNRTYGYSTKKENLAIIGTHHLNKYLFSMYL